MAKLEISNGLRQVWQKKKKKKVLLRDRKKWICELGRNNVEGFKQRFLKSLRHI